MRLRPIALSVLPLQKIAPHSGRGLVCSQNGFACWVAHRLCVQSSFAAHGRRQGVIDVVFHNARAVARGSVGGGGGWGAWRALAAAARRAAASYQTKIDELERTVLTRELDLLRLTAQRNELNARVRLLREELHQLQEPGSYVGEVVKAMGKTKILVKVRAPSESESSALSSSSASSASSCPGVDAALPRPDVAPEGRVASLRVAPRRGAASFAWRCCVVRVWWSGRAGIAREDALPAWIALLDHAVQPATRCRHTRGPRPAWRERAAGATTKTGSGRVARGACPPRPRLSSAPLTPTPQHDRERERSELDPSLRL